LICFKVATISQTYGIKQNILAAITNTTAVYPSLNGENSGDLTQGISSPLNLRAPFGTHCGLDGVPFKLSPRFSTQPSGNSATANSVNPNLNINLDAFDYNFRLERSILGRQN